MILIGPPILRCYVFQAAPTVTDTSGSSGPLASNEYATDDKRNAQRLYIPTQVRRSQIDPSLLSQQRLILSQNASQKSADSPRPHPCAAQYLRIRCPSSCRLYLLSE
ncbi:hypothetical protein PoB_003280900 [Plakobranchus ocellatus]|uniref:Uncharacterized protein n=1 Tax=Plakobranchus ocellatus TaxID=259542 RepID=A0AAV4AF71_9GAST|nr:hypothetical protein PoB_003280900 [Plakobranchus ocellatus]